jgi:hypothetical protein
MSRFILNFKSLSQQGAPADAASADGPNAIGLERATVRGDTNINEGENPRPVLAAFRMYVVTPHHIKRLHLNIFNPSFINQLRL